MTAKRAVLLGLALALIAALVFVTVTAGRAALSARRALQSLERIDTLIGGKPSLAALPALSQEAAELERHVTVARSAAAPFLRLAPALGRMPVVGPTLAAAPALADLAVETAAGGRIALSALAPAIVAMDEGGSDRLGALAAGLAQAGPALSEAEAHFTRAIELRARLDPAMLPDSLQRPISRLDAVLPLAAPALEVARLAPDLLGAAGPRTYLVIPQNNHEIRPTGGFISGAGLVRLDQGRITELRFSDSYAVDDLTQPHPQPSSPLREQLGAGILLYRDSNWSPDFPTTAEVARALYAQDQGVETDGAVAVDLEAVRLLVDALGPLQVPGTPEPVTGANALEWMKQAWETPATAAGTVAEAQTSDWWRRRKDFMGELVAAAVTKLQEGDLDLAALARASAAMLRGRHLQIALDDPGAAATLAERGWDGALAPPETGDFLAVIDANVGFNKANAALNIRHGYRVESAAAGPEAALDIELVHGAPPMPATQACDRQPRYGDTYDDMVRRCYYGYVRVYAPAGSVLLDAQGLMGSTAEEGEGGAAVFSGAYTIRPGEAHTIELRYRLPESVNLGNYRLFVRKQAGTPDIPLHVEAAGCTWDLVLDRDRRLACRNGEPVPSAP
jgi:hypothetical protein